MLDKFWIILIIIFIVFISGCTNSDIGPLDNEQNTDDEAQPRQGCDGICDDFERQNPESPCYSDCSGLQPETQTNEEIQQPERIPPLIEVTMESTGSSYSSTNAKPSGWFTDNQEADIMLSGFGFNNAGGPLLFNHQGGVATDGIHLILADRNNNRVLIWNSLPRGNTNPNIVLGQKDFISNNPGKELDNLNWPVGVATDGKRVIVADTYNDRILIWNSFPTQNGQTADISLQGSSNPNEYANIGWPWDIWTDGSKMIVTSTASSQILIWNSFPTQNNQKPDIVIALDDFGTPRSIGSDGTNLVIGDHNAFKKDRGNFFWKTFPTKENQPYDFFMADTRTNTHSGEIFWGLTFTPEGKLIMISDKLHIWNSFPQNENDFPDLSIGYEPATGGYEFGGRQSGDGSGIALAGDMLYVSLCNGNKIVGFDSIPTSQTQKPDFVIGSPDIDTNTLETEFIISNPVPATDGKSLFVSSDFDQKLYVWTKIPDENGANPDYVYSLPDAPWDNALHDDKLVLAGKTTIFIWYSLPLNGELPDRIIRQNIGSVSFQEIGGITIDDTYFYISDPQAGKIYVWDGIPSDGDNPKFQLNVDQAYRLSSNGEYLAAATFSGPGGSIMIFDVDNLQAQPKILGGMFNLPQGVLVYGNSLFVGDTGFNTVHIWADIQDALNGKEADILLDEKDYKPEIGKDSLFWPSNLAFDGSYLWVGEFKFSERLLRLSVK